MSKKVRCRFPASRIKKIMQTDEDVGKIARDTPVLMSRALELFVIDLVKQSAEISKERNSPLLHPCHLKQCIQKIEVFDFLEEIASKVPDNEPEPKRRPKRTKEGEEECDEVEPEPEPEEEEEEEEEEDEDMEADVPPPVKKGARGKQSAKPRGKNAKAKAAPKPRSRRKASK